MIRRIKDFPDYHVGSAGQVFKGLKQLKPSVQPSGYVKIYLYKDGKRYVKYLHRIVAEAFIDNPKGLPEVNHKDGNKGNNCVDNLEWIDRIGNMRHGKGMPVNQIKDGVVIHTFSTLSQAAVAVGDKSHGANICECLKGRRKTAHGYEWRYADKAGEI